MNVGHPQFFEEKMKPSAFTLEPRVVKWLDKTTKFREASGKVNKILREAMEKEIAEGKYSEDKMIA